MPLLQLSIVQEPCSIVRMCVFRVRTGLAAVSKSDGARHWYTVQLLLSAGCWSSNRVLTHRKTTEGAYPFSTTASAARTIARRPGDLRDAGTVVHTLVPDPRQPSLESW